MLFRSSIVAISSISALVEAASRRNTSFRTFYVSQSTDTLLQSLHTYESRRQGALSDPPATPHLLSFRFAKSLMESCAIYHISGKVLVP